ncbi:hypothetical protein ACFIOZ_05655 [Vreelandella sp. F11]|uniref:hypothetical protein n=1 Tax=Vreelandella sp. F11 TaxID=3394751 RepID=UPI0036DF09A3
MPLPAPPNAWIRFLAHLLFILAAWTLFIKYLFPVGYALAYGEPWARYIYWDLWPVAHVWLGWALLKQPRYTRALAVGMSVIEILIIGTLSVRFLNDPEWSIWRTNWFVNKVFVLTCFVLVLAATVPSPKKWKERPL